MSLSSSTALERADYWVGSRFSLPPPMGTGQLRGLGEFGRECTNLPATVSGLLVTEVVEVEYRNQLSRFGVVDVSGPSMSPTLANGDQVAVRYGTAVRPGHIVVLRHPFRQDLLVIKRATEQRGDGTWWVLGDNPYNKSGDSNDFGAVPEGLMLATAFLRFRPRAKDQHGLRARLTWLLAAVRPLRADAAATSRLRSS